MSKGMLVRLTETNRPLLIMMTEEKSIPEDAVSMALTEEGYLYFTEDEHNQAIQNLSQGRLLFPKMTFISYYEVEFED